MLKTDFGLKYIALDVDRKEILIFFRYTYWKGIYDISVFIDGVEKEFKIKCTYPKFTRRILELVILIVMRLENLINRTTNTGH